MDYTQKTLSQAGSQAAQSGVDVAKLDEKLVYLKTKYNKSFSDINRTLLYLAASGVYNANDIIEMSGRKATEREVKNFNTQFNKCIGTHLRNILTVDEDDRLGFTSLRRILHKNGLMCNFNEEKNIDILRSTHEETLENHPNFSKENQSY